MLLTVFTLTVLVVVAGTSIIASAASASTSTLVVTTVSVISEAIGSVILATSLPVIWITIASITSSPLTVISASVSSSPTTTSATTSIDSWSWLNLAILDLLCLLIHVLLLWHDFQSVLGLPERLGVKLEERIRSLFVLELDKDRALEELLLGATEANRVGGTVWGEESFDVKLRAGLLIAKTLCVDGSRLGLGSWGSGIICEFTPDFFETFGTSNFEELAISEGGNNSRMGTEALHATEGAKSRNLDWQVVGTICGIPHELVPREVAVTKVKFDLLASVLAASGSC